MAVIVLHKFGPGFAQGFDQLAELFLQEKVTGLTIDISVPTMNVDMAGALLSVPAIYYANISDKIIMIEDEFGHEENNGASSHILLIPEVDGLKKIMESLGLDT